MNEIAFTKLVGQLVHYYLHFLLLYMIINSQGNH